MVAVRTSGLAIVLLHLWAQRYLPTGDSSCYVGYQKLITAILFSKLVHHRAPQNMSISVMLFWFKNTTPQAKHGTLYRRHIGSRTVGRSEVTELNSKKLKTATNFTLFHSKGQNVWICLCCRQIMQHVLYWWGQVKYRFYKTSKRLWALEENAELNFVMFVDSLGIATGVLNFWDSKGWSPL